MGFFCRNSSGETDECDKEALPPSYMPLFSLAGAPVNAAGRPCFVHVSFVHRAQKICGAYSVFSFVSVAVSVPDILIKK